MALVECRCGTRVFLLRGRPGRAVCPDCGEPLLRPESAAEAESRVRFRLYGGVRPDGAPPGPRPRDIPPAA